MVKCNLFPYDVLFNRNFRFKETNNFEEKYHFLAIWQCEMLELNVDKEKIKTISAFKECNSYLKRSRKVTMCYIFVYIFISMKPIYSHFWQKLT